MTSAWQSCQGDYRPQELFVRGDSTVIARNIRQVEDGLWQWEEYAVKTEDYNAIHTVVEESSPFSASKTAYIMDTEVVFDNVPDGGVSALLSNPQIAHTVTRSGSRVVVSFEPLEEVTKITILVR